MRRALGDDLQQADVGPQLVRRVGLRAGAQIEVIDGRIDRPGREAREGLIERGRDVLGDLVLDGEDVLEAAVVAIRPQGRLRRRLDQMRADAHAPARAADGAVEDVRALQALRRFGLALAAKLKARRAADHLQLRAARQPLDDLLAHAVREELHLGIVRQIVEGQHGEQRLGGSGLRRRARSGRHAGAAPATRWPRLRRPRAAPSPNLPAA